MISKYLKVYISSHKDGTLNTALCFYNFVWNINLKLLVHLFAFSPLDHASSTAQAIETEHISTQKLPWRFVVHNEAVINYEEKLTAECQTAEQIF